MCTTLLVCIFFRARYLELYNQLWFPCGRIFLLLSVLLSCPQFFVECREPVSFPHCILSYLLVLSFFRSYIGRHLNEPACSLFHICQRHNFTVKSCCSGSNALLPLLHWSLSWYWFQQSQHDHLQFMLETILTDNVKYWFWWNKWHEIFWLTPWLRT